MKEKLSALPIDPQKIGIPFSPSFHDTDMLPNERLFVSGLIKYYEPKHILEVGVAGGGGTVNVLNTIMDMDADLTSVDICETFNHPFIGAINVGQFVYDMYPHIPENKFRLCLGEDPAVCMPKLNQKFDFCILDTGHVHPCETLNFLCILPYLEEDAIVILHDISLYTEMSINTNKDTLSFLATRILLSCICADKLLANYDPRGVFVNIGAFQLSSDTISHIRNVFDSLFLPWEYWPRNLDIVSAFVDLHYDDSVKKLWHDSIEFNAKLQKSVEERRRELKVFADFFETHGRNRIIFYGAGFNMRGILRNFKACGAEFNYQIWDKNAENIRKLQEYDVALPDYVSKANEGDIIIVTIGDYEIFQCVRKQFEPLGYSVFHGYEEALQLL